MRVRAGTSGYSYPAWKGGFYPEDLPAARMLAHYAGRLPTVEINNTFYRMPDRSMLRRWVDETPSGFSFAIKSPRRITHEKRLLEGGDSVARLFDVTSELGDRLGPVLFQLPPNLKKDVPRLAAFLALLPRSARSAFEFRHASWFDEDVYDALRVGGAALCIADAEGLTTPLVPTASWGYLRLRRQDYTAADVQAWADRILAQPWDDVLVYFKHEDEGLGPKLAAALAAVCQTGC